jgi:hypothetical protein
MFVVVSFVALQGGQAATVSLANVMYAPGWQHIFLGTITFFYKCRESKFAHSLNCDDPGVLP